MSAATSLAVTFFTDQFATTKTEQSVALDELATLIETTTGPNKLALPWLKLARFGDRRTDKRSLRHDANLLAITGIEADYDGELISVVDAHTRLAGAGILCIVYTSPSHTVPRPRWRALAPLSLEYPPEYRDRFLGRLNGLFGGIFANESWTWSQSYFYGSINRNPSHQVVLLDGQPIDLASELDAIAIGRPEKSEATQGKIERPVYPAADPSRITDKRLNGKLHSLLANLSNAPKGSVHNTLLRVSRAVGGYAWLLPYSETELLGILLNALPPDDHPDPVSERKTAMDGLQHGMRSPLHLEERPLPPRSSRAQFEGRPSA